MTAIAAGAYAAAAVPPGLLGLPLSGIWISLPVDASLVLLYFHLYMGVFRSLSVRVLEELAASPEGRLTPAKLDARYSRRGMFTSRLEVLEEHGWIARHGTAYVSTAKGSRAAALIVRLRRLYGIRGAG